jgi:branched-chain amino acid aminotransferase
MAQVKVDAAPQYPSKVLDPSALGFGETFSPNFFVMQFENGRWQDPRIEPLKNLILHPASLVFHYAQTIFEGLKAYRQTDDTVVLFRPELNAERFNRSAARMAMPMVEKNLFLEALHELVQTERHFVPMAPGSLYLRPTMIASDACIGIRSSTRFIFYILALPTGAYFKEAGMGTRPIDVLVSHSVVRAFYGGTGDIKTGANYAVTLQITSTAREHGCSQVLFLDAVNRNAIEEMGGMNVFFVRDGRLITPPLSGTILAGVVRQSILDMAGDVGLEAVEAPVLLSEILPAIADGSVTEAFACGTAACIAPIGRLRFEDRSSVTLGHGEVGSVAARLYDALQAIYYGRAPDPYGWTKPVCRIDAPLAS